MSLVPAPDGQPGTDATLLPPSAAETLARVREILTRSRHRALQTVNSAMVEAYWRVGREIVEEEQRGSRRAEYGVSLLDMLASSLTAEFGSGFIPRNLRYMRDFYGAFPIWNAVRSELSWTHYRILFRYKLHLPTQEELRQELVRERDHLLRDQDPS